MRILPRRIVSRWIEGPAFSEAGRRCARSGGGSRYFCAGDQTGWLSRRPAARVRLRCALPSAPMIQMSSLPPRLLTYAIRRPSGDRRAIAEGEAKPGERLPPAKDLAAVLGVNTNTVLRSLRLLRDEGLLEFRRGRGISVAGTPERGAVIQRAKELVAFARQQGYRVDEIVQIIEEVG